MLASRIVVDVDGFVALKQKNACDLYMFHVLKR